MNPFKRFMPLGIADAWLVAVAVALLAVFSLLAESRFEHVYRRQVERNLQVVLDTTLLALENWSRNEKSNAVGWAGDQAMRAALRVLSGVPPARLAAHPLHAVIGQELALVVAARGYLDYRLIAADGRVMSSSIEGNIGERTRQPPFDGAFFSALRETGAALAAPNAENAPASGLGIPPAFVGARLLDDDGRLLGFLVFRIDPWQELAAHLAQARQGASGETYGIDRAGLMIGASRFELDLWRAKRLGAGESAMLKLRVAAPGPDGEDIPTRAAAALARRERGIDSDGYPDYRGVEVVGAWGWSRELDFGVVTEMDRAEAYEQIFWLRGGLVLLFAAFAALSVYLLRVALRGAKASGRQQLLESMLESCPLGSGVVDDAGNVLFINNRVIELLGASRETLLATPSHRWFQQPEDRLPIRERLVAGEGIAGVAVPVRRADGTAFPALLSVVPVAISGARRFIVWLEDVSDHKRVEDELRRAGAMAETASRMKSAFLANMSHEIRTPINAVLNFTRLALEGGGLAPRQRAFLEKGLMAAESLLVLVNDVLDLSKIEAGRLELEMQPFQMPRVFAQVTGMLGERVRQKGLSLAVAVAPDIPRTLRGDPVRLVQVLINLLANAIKFTERGGIDFRVERVAGGAPASRVQLRFSVRDTGIGIDAGALPRLFRPFAQADASISRQYGGSGLGLSISERLVGMMGGGIEVDSRPGVGSTFSFVLAFDIAEDDAANGAVESIIDTAALAGRRVLVAEDNPLNQEVIREYLERVGVRAVVVGDGRKAVERVLDPRGVPFDAVLMDMQMPELDGVAATLQLRATPRGANLPIVAVTAGALLEEKKRCLDAGMNDYMTKPYDPETLYRMLIAWIGEGTPPAPAATAAGIDDAAGDAADFDARALDRIATDAKARQRLASIYLDTLATARRELAAALATGDFAALAALCHRVKSSSLAMGARGAGKALGEVEAAALARDPAMFERAARLEEFIAAASDWARRLIAENQGEGTQ